MVQELVELRLSFGTGVFEAIEGSQSINTTQAQLSRTINLARQAPDDRDGEQSDIRSNEVQEIITLPPTDGQETDENSNIHFIPYQGSKSGSLPKQDSLGLGSALGVVNEAPSGHFPESGKAEDFSCLSLDLLHD
ncbi:hypothetical protein Pmani_004045 [Petrolisthes manimaculis]|uniref:Uncharacterized protein n=1 Tax=Petrolisthes manimaculis TaxID=1843537 RepID=A0AAE1QET8_9EUCA|nr:hypothetical protein Pmani_032088 [Petrolisthes manimaculis]KAK4325366.1 hypothetical protein Pmani_004045 [Petrolisthes manimaculis]